MENKEARKILGVGVFATKAEIKEAHRKKSLVHHPDRGGSGEEQVKLNSALDTLLGADRSILGFEVESVRSAIELVADNLETATDEKKDLGLKVLEIAEGTVTSPLYAGIKKLFTRRK